MRTATVLTLLLTASVARAQEAASAPDVHTLEQRIDDLEQQHRILVRQLELADEKRVEKAKDTPVVTFGKDGFVFRTADGKSFLRLHALLQADGRAFLGDDKNAIPDTFLLRRVRPIL